MEKADYIPINNQVEPDLLQYIKSTFGRWEKLTSNGVTVGTRELNNFAFTLKGAAMNSHIGFSYAFNPCGEDEAGRPAITLKIYTAKEQKHPGAENPAFTFVAALME